MQSMLWTLLIFVCDHLVMETHHTGNWKRESLKVKKKRGNEERQKKEGTQEKDQFCSGKGTKAF